MIDLKPPSKLFVGNYDFTILWVPRGHAELCAEGDTPEGNDGLTHLDRRVIAFADDLQPRLLLEIVTHEITHAINWERGIEDAEGAPESDEFVTCSEEEIADRHGKAWPALFLDNPKFQRWHTRVLNHIRKEQKDA